MEILPESTSNSSAVGTNDGVAASFQRSRIHKPHAHTHAFKVNHSTPRLLILNFPTIKEPQIETDDPFDDLDEVLGYYANTGKEIIVRVEENDTSGSDSKDLDYDPKHDELYDDDEHILKDVLFLEQDCTYVLDPEV
ncbi:hypothetical protein Tco_0040121 [Tanacetum coccineum]